MQTEIEELKAAARLLIAALNGFDADSLKRRVSEIDGPTYDEAMDRLSACLYDAVGNCR